MVQGAKQQDGIEAARILREAACVSLGDGEWTRSSFRRSGGLLDMQRHHRVLFGKDVLKDLRIPLDLHRVQVEYELREKLILLRHHVLLASENDSRLWDLLQHSVSSLLTLFRHALIALGQEPPATRREAVQVLAQRLGFDAAVFLRVLDAREKKEGAKKIDVRDLASRYLAAVEKVAGAVDAA